MRVGIVGQGFVGSAVYEGFKKHYPVETYDKFKKSSCQSLEELCSKTDFIFICLPTPMNRDGSCDLRVVEGVISEIDSFGYEKILILKSTVPPGTTAALNNYYKNVKIVFNPEFLTEANHLEDFKSQNRIIIGGPRPYSTKVKTLFKKAFSTIPIIKTHSTIAETVKYFLNCLLATKVSFANEIKSYCDLIGVDYDKVVEYALYDERIGKTHLHVPGPDGKPGFGGSCFPKDINALIYEMEKQNLNPIILKAIWDQNLRLRPEKDWERLEGRAVSHE